MSASEDDDVQTAGDAGASLNNNNGSDNISGDDDGVVPLDDSRPNNNHKKNKKQRKNKRLSEAETAKRGVVYINRPPPYMRPDKVRHLLQQYAPVTRIYLAPEDETVRRRRRKDGGNRKKRYSEGWVEFESRKSVGWQDACYCPARAQDARCLDWLHRSVPMLGS